MIAAAERCAQLAAHVHAVGVGQFQVEQHHVRVAPAQRGGAGLHVVDLVAAPLQGPDQLFRDPAVVLDDEHACPVSRPGRAAQLAARGHAASSHVLSSS